MQFHSIGASGAEVTVVFLFEHSYTIWFCGMVLADIIVSGLSAIRLAY